MKTKNFKSNLTNITIENLFGNIFINNKLKVVVFTYV